MTKDLLTKIMNKNYNFPNIAALVHATLLVFLMAGLIIWAYVFLAPGVMKNADTTSFSIISLHRYFFSNKIPLLMAFGLLAGLNELVYYLLFRLRKKPAAYSVSAAVLTLQVAVITGGLTML